MISKRKKAQLEKKAEQRRLERVRAVKAGAKRHGLIYDGEKLIAPARERSTGEYKGIQSYRRETPNIPSYESKNHYVAKVEPMRYTGNLVVGIATMHKSNAVPVISKEHAEDISKMRRG
jgi:hypothetical protein